MDRLRLTVASLMATVLYFALGFAALRSGSTRWASALSTLAVLIIATATLSAIANRDRARFVRAGFAIFGWSYLLLGFPVDPGAYEPRPLSFAPVPMEYLYSYVVPNPLSTETQRSFIWTCHAILALSFGLLGGVLGYFVGDRSNEPRDPE